MDNQDDGNLQVGQTLCIKTEECVRSFVAGGGGVGMHARVGLST